jgi:hypothetical protein
LRWRLSFRFEREKEQRIDLSYFLLPLSFCPLLSSLFPLLLSGMGFNERNDAFDFTAAIQDHQKYPSLSSDSSLFVFLSPLSPFLPMASPIPAPETPLTV